MASLRLPTQRSAGGRPVPSAATGCCWSPACPAPARPSALKALRGHRLRGDRQPAAFALLGNKLVPAAGCAALAGIRLLAVGVDVRTRDFATEALIAGSGAARRSCRRRPRSSFSRLRRRRAVPALQGRPATAIRSPSIGRFSTASPPSGSSGAVARPRRPRHRHHRASAGRPEASAGRALSACAIKPALLIFVTSFSYRRGLPREADLVFDVRFLTNPHYDRTLRPLTGRDRAGRRVSSADDRRSRRSSTTLTRCSSRCCRATLPREELPDHRRRLHGRSPPLGFRRRTAGAAWLETAGRARASRTS